VEQIKERVRNELSFEIEFGSYLVVLVCLLDLQ
jgi:hypothetical protein